MQRCFLIQSKFMSRLSVIITFLSIVLCSCGAGKPKGGEGISYWSPAWLNNERIIYTKQVETVKFNYGWLAEIGNNTSERIWTDYFICTMDLNGEDEKILKQFRFVEAGVEGSMPRYYIIEGDKKIKIPDIIIPPLTQDYYSCSKDLIVFSSGTIYTMKTDGSELKKIGKGGYARLSPDGKLILYTATDPSAIEAYERYFKRHQGEFPNEPPPPLLGALWLINIDGTGKRKLVEPGTEGIWDPTGRKILYSEGLPGYDCHLLELGENYHVLSNKKFEWGGRIYDWSPDGKYVLAAGTRDTETWNHFKLTKLAAIPTYPRLSPDGEKIVGSNAGLDADICVVYIDSTDRDKAIKVLKKTHFKKWDK